MRHQYLPVMALLAVGVSAPARAQLVTTATPDTVVARLMSFDRNADGKIVVDELPERMQSLLTRGDSSNDGALDPAEVRRLAASPAPQRPILNGVEEGRYGFGENFSFDTSQHIDGALDDLRLAGDTKKRAIEIARKFMADTDASVLDDLLSTMGRILSPEQLDDFRAAVGGRTVSVPAIRRDGVTMFGALPEESAGQERVMVRVRLVAPVDLERHVEKYELDVDPKRQALAAIRQFKTHTPGRLNETERLALMEQLRGLLTDGERDDLRAALARRPVVKLGTVTGIVDTLRFVGPKLADAPFPRTDAP